MHWFIGLVHYITSLGPKEVALHVPFCFPDVSLEQISLSLLSAWTNRQVFRTGQVVGARSRVKPVFQFTRFSRETWSNLLFRLCIPNEYSLPFDNQISTSDCLLSLYPLKAVIGFMVFRSL